MQRLWQIVLLCYFIVAAHGRGFAISPGFVETFSSGLGGWQKGQADPNYLSIVSSGGPAGAGDAYMQSVADGAGQFGRLTVFNTQQWSADFVANGVTSISMDLLNEGAVPLAIRIGFRGVDGSGYISTTPFSLPAGGSWQTASFPVSEAGMTAVGSPGSLPLFLAAGDFQFRILNASGTANLQGDPVVSTLGIDNISAVPEPSVLALASSCVAIGSFLMAGRLVRRKNSDRVARGLRTRDRDDLTECLARDRSAG